MGRKRAITTTDDVAEAVITVIQTFFLVVDNKNGYRAKDVMHLCTEIMYILKHPHEFRE